MELPSFFHKHLASATIVIIGCIFSVCSDNEPLSDSLKVVAARLVNERKIKFCTGCSDWVSFMSFQTFIQYSA